MGVRWRWGSATCAWHHIPPLCPALVPLCFSKVVTLPSEGRPREESEGGVFVRQRPSAVGFLVPHRAHTLRRPRRQADPASGTPPHFSKPAPPGWSSSYWETPSLRELPLTYASSSKPSPPRAACVISQAHSDISEGRPVPQIPDRMPASPSQDLSLCLCSGHRETRHPRLPFPGPGGLPAAGNTRAECRASPCREAGLDPSAQPRASGRTPGRAPSFSSFLGWE